MKQYKRVLSVVTLVFLGSLGVQAQYTYTNMTAGVGTNWSTVTSWKSTNGKPANGGSSDTVIHLQAQGNSDQPAMFVDIGTAANNGFMLNALVLTNTAVNYNRGFILSGSNLVFMSNAGASPMILGNSGSIGYGNGFTINNTIILSNSLTIAGVDNGGAVRKIQGVITGVGDITNAVVNNNATGCLQINNTANTFVGNWVLSAGIVQFATGDGTYGNTANGVILLNNAQFQPVSTPATLSWNNARVLTIGAGGGTISAQNVSRTLSLSSTTSLAGSELLTLGGNGSLTLNANQVNFIGPVQVGGSVTAVATLTLAASNALANASRIVAGNYGLVNLNNAFGAGMLTITNLANSQTTLGTNLVASDGTTLYLNDLSAVSGTDVRLNSLTSGGNLTIAPGAVPMVLHVDANGTAVPSGVNRSSLVYGITANRGNMTIGDADANQWRGVGVGVGSAVTLGTASSNLTLNGNAELDALTGGTLTINSLITDGDATKLLAIRGGGTVVLNNVNNNFASRIFGAGGTTLSASHTAGTMTFNLANTNNTFGSIKNNSTGTLVLNGEFGSTNILAGSFGGAAGGTIVFSNGYYKSLGGQRHTAGNLTVAGGTFVVTGDRLGMEYANQQLTIFGGSLIATNASYGFRLGSDGGYGQAASASANFTALQTNGIVAIYTSGMELGGFLTANVTNRYTLSGGSLTLAGSGISLWLGSKDSTAPTSFVLSNQGVLSVQGKIMGGTANTAASMALFIFNGGTLTAETIDATRLASDVAPTTQGLFVNSGGTLAPGTIGMAGKTTITGSYSNAPTATLAIDIGGTAPGSAFQTGTYDYLSVSANAVLDGRLAVSLINGYAPATTATKFTVLTSTGLTGAFANVSAGKVWCADGYSRFDVLTNATANAVVLSNYVINAWSPTSGSTWDTAANWALATEPNGSAFGAYFGTGGSGTVTLDTAHTVRGLTFTNSTASYTIAGAALTLQGDTMTAPKISVLAGSHTISAAMVLSNATEIAVAGFSVLTLSGNVTGGQAVTKTGAGTLELGGVNTLGSLTVSAGTVRFASDSTTVIALIITAGATCDFTAGTLYILKNGGGTDTLDEVNAAITANTFTLRGKSAQPIDFKVTEEGGYIKVTAKVKGTMIMMM